MCVCGGGGELNILSLSTLKLYDWSSPREAQAIIMTDLALGGLKLYDWSIALGGLKLYDWSIALGGLKLYDF